MSTSVLQYWWNTFQIPIYVTNFILRFARQAWFQEQRTSISVFLMHFEILQLLHQSFQRMRLADSIPNFLLSKKNPCLLPKTASMLLFNAAALIHFFSHEQWLRIAKFYWSFSNDRLPFTSRLSIFSRSSFCEQIKELVCWHNDFRRFKVSITPYKGNMSNLYSPHLLTQSLFPNKALTLYYEPNIVCRN